jgi:putative hemolysin
VSAISIDTPGKEALRHITETGFSRYPVYRDTPETVVGVLFNKDIFRALEAGTEIVLADLIRKPYFIPNSIMISRLLRELQKRKVHMAIVVDEHGEIDGVVTIEDILEEIVGEIEDEYDAGRDDLVEKLADGTMVIDASASIRDLEDFGIIIGEEEADEYHTLAGFMLAKLQRIPRGGEFVGYKDKRYTVVDIEANRIVKVKVEPIFGKGESGGKGKDGGTDDPTGKEPGVKEPTTTQVGQA